LTQGTSSGYHPQLGQIIFGIEPEFVSIEPVVVSIVEAFVVATFAAVLAPTAEATAPARDAALCAALFFISHATS